MKDGAVYIFNNIYNIFNNNIGSNVVHASVCIYNLV